MSILYRIRILLAYAQDLPRELVWKLFDGLGLPACPGCWSVKVSAASATASGWRSTTWYPAGPKHHDHIWQCPACQKEMQ